MRDWCPRCSAMVLVNSTIDHEKGTRTVFCYQCVAIIDVVPLAPARTEQPPVIAPIDSRTAPESKGDAFRAALESALVPMVGAILADGSEPNDPAYQRQPFGSEGAKWVATTNWGCVVAFVYSWPGGEFPDHVDTLVRPLVVYPGVELQVGPATNAPEADEDARNAWLEHMSRAGEGP